MYACLILIILRGHDAAVRTSVEECARLREVLQLQHSSHQQLVARLESDVQQLSSELSSVRQKAKHDADAAVDHWKESQKSLDVSLW